MSHLFSCSAVLLASSQFANSLTGFLRLCLFCCGFFKNSLNFLITVNVYSLLPCYRFGCLLWQMVRFNGECITTWEKYMDGRSNGHNYWLDWLMRFFCLSLRGRQTIASMCVWMIWWFDEWKYAVISAHFHKHLIDMYIHTKIWIIVSWKMGQVYKWAKRLTTFHRGWHVSVLINGWLLVSSSSSSHISDLYQADIGFGIDMIPNQSSEKGPLIEL